MHESEADFRWPELVLALPFGLSLCLYMKLVAVGLRTRIEELRDLPDNAILYFFHRQSMAVASNKSLYRVPANRVVWLSAHGFRSYVFSFWPTLTRTSLFFYDRRSRVKPFDQLAAFLTRNPHTRIGFATDAGGPYGEVRRSLLQLSLRTGRPVVALKHRASPCFTLAEHEFLLPGSRLEAVLSRPIPASELAALEETRALQLLQTTLDDL
jgi:hypothetical protein